MSYEPSIVPCVCGTAGNVIASRLSENPRVSVLVIEAGGKCVLESYVSQHTQRCFSNEEIVNTMIPFAAPNLLANETLFWNYAITPQRALDRRVVQYPRGRLLGGSSSVSKSPVTICCQKGGRVD